MRRFVQSPGVIAVLHADGTYRQIFMDGRALEPDPLPIFQGYSVGRWDGDTLVVESNGYNEKTWLHPEGLGHTEQLRITERYRRVDFGHMQVDITFEDPGAFDTPLHAVVSLEYAADDEILELVCNEATEGGMKHWVGDKAADARATAVSVAPEILAKYVGTYKGIWLELPDHGRRHARERHAVLEPKRRREERAARAVRHDVRVQHVPVGSAVHLQSRRRRHGDRSARGAGLGRLDLQARAVTRARRRR